MKNRDFRLREQLETFGVRVSALIIENQKLLLIYAPHLDKYYLPGGALQVGEDSNKAVAKEGTHKRHFVWLPIKELTKIDCNPNFLAQDLIEWPGHVVHKIVQN